MRSLQIAAFAMGLLWLLAAQVGAESAAQGIVRLLHGALVEQLLQRCFYLILLLTGFTALSWVAFRQGGVRAVNALPRRASSAVEWQKGLALGWAGALLSILPAALAGDLHPMFWFAPRAWVFAALSLATALVGALGTEVAFRGFLFKRLIAVLGPTSATVVVSALQVLSVTSLFPANAFRLLVTGIAAIVCALAYLRTHGLWLGWGLRFGWFAAMGVIFGLPAGGTTDAANVVITASSGRPWLSGGVLGPEGSLITAAVLLGGLFAVYRLTRDYAWHYTHDPIVAGGYPMDVPPPAAHTAMQPPAPPPLVQILGAVPITQMLPQRPAPPPRVVAAAPSAPEQTTLPHNLD